MTHVSTAPPSSPSARDGRVALGGDGQVSIGETVMKSQSTKVRALKGGKVLAGLRRLGGRRAHAVREVRGEARPLSRPTSRAPRSSWPRTGGATGSSAGSRRCWSWPTWSTASS